MKGGYSVADKDLSVPAEQQLAESRELHYDSRLTSVSVS